MTRDKEIAQKFKENEGEVLVIKQPDLIQCIFTVCQYLQLDPPLKCICIKGISKQKRQKQQRVSLHLEEKSSCLNNALLTKHSPNHMLTEVIRYKWGHCGSVILQTSE